jgi:dTMP kinase
LWIVFEGPDKSGKDTQLHMVSEKLKELNIDHINIKDPSPDVASDIRKILLEEELNQATRLYLYLAARAELLFKQIVPALQQKKVVLCNRYMLSTLAYQGIYFTSQKILQAAEAGGILDPRPDLQIIYLPPEPLEQKQQNIMDQYCFAFWKQIRQNYLSFSNNSGIEIIHVNSPPEVIFQRTWDMVSFYIQKKEMFS